jgi:glycosyltransferase involved in cell wall biosynthesis
MAMRLIRGERPQPSRGARPGKRILLVSDSLGTPIHARGIFHYTANLVRALRRCGHEIVLLIERTPAHDALGRGGGALGSVSPAALRAAELGIVYDYLHRNEFIGRYPAKADWRRWLARRLGLLDQAVPLLTPRGVAQMLRFGVAAPYAIVPNACGALGFVPPRLDHLRSVAAFAQSDAIYSIAFASAYYGFGAAAIDVSDFDLVIVDTPTHLRFRRGAETEIVAVIHDLIPLADPTLPGRWRRIFVNRLVCTTAAADSYVFVSEATRQHFATLFPEDGKAGRATILHPAVDDGIAGGSPAGCAIGDPAGGDPGGGAVGEPGGTAGDYIVAIVSDEPRKNLATLIEAFAFLPRSLGLKIVGHLWDRHFSPEAAARRASTYGPGRIELLGYVDEPRKKAALAGALGLVMPSHTEGFGIPLVEGLFFGKPVFCSDIPIFREVVGEGGFYFDPSSPQSIAAAVRRYLDAPAAFRGGVAAAARKARERFALSALERAVATRFGRATVDAA